MADASHELRTPVTTRARRPQSRCSSRIATEHEYRQTLAIVEQQTTRLSRIVDDMFTLARADAGSYPVRQTPMYLDEVVDEVVRAARVVASPRACRSDRSGRRSPRPSPATRSCVGRLDRQPARQRHPARSARHINLASAGASADGYTISDQRSRGRASREENPAPHLRAAVPRRRGARPCAAGRRRRPWPGGGAVDCNVHGGDVKLARSSEAGTPSSSRRPCRVRLTPRRRLSSIHPPGGNVVPRDHESMGVFMSDDTRSMIPMTGLLATMSFAAYMVVQLGAQAAVAAAADFTNAAVAEIRDAQGHRRAPWPVRTRR